MRTIDVFILFKGPFPNLVYMPLLFRSLKLSLLDIYCVLFVDDSRYCIFLVININSVLFSIIFYNLAIISLEEQNRVFIGSHNLPPTVFLHFCSNIVY